MVNFTSKTYQMKREILTFSKNTKIDNKTTNSLCLQFTTLKEKIVLVKSIIDKNKNYYKTYQYQNKNWVEIPTTDEYKF